MSFSPFNWIRDFFGIRKDWIDAKKALVDTEKATLEVRRLQDEERARTLITPATLDDVKTYDPKIKAIDRGIEKERVRILRQRNTRLAVLTISMVFVSTASIIFTTLRPAGLGGDPSTPTPTPTPEIHTAEIENAIKIYYTEHPRPNTEPDAPIKIIRISPETLVKRRYGVQVDVTMRDGSSQFDRLFCHRSMEGRDDWQCER